MHPKTWLILDASDPLPIPQQLVHRFLAAIAAEILKPGQSIPSEREVLSLTGVARKTVRRAYEVLAEDSYIEFRPQRPPIVTKNITKQKAQVILQRAVFKSIHNSVLTAKRSRMNRDVFLKEVYRQWPAS